MAKDEKMQQILESLEKGVREFFETDKYKDYLNTMSSFHQYSLNNQLLICMQNPDASLVAGYTSWIKNFDRHVMKGEKAITILAPQKRMIEIETDRADENGNAITEKREMISFRPVSVFDVSQTEGKELPQIITKLQGSIENYSDFMAALQQASPYIFNIMEVDSRANGWCDYVSETVAIKAGMSEMQTIKTAVHETAHARVHNLMDGKSREQREVEAESIAYVVCNHYGIDTSEYSFGYVATWAGRNDDQMLRNCLNTIRNEAKDIIDIVDRGLNEKQMSIGGMTQAEIEKQAAAIVEDALTEMGSMSQVIAAKVYGHSRIMDDPETVNVMVEFEGTDREDGLFNVIHENPVKINGMDIDINPIKADKSGNIDDYFTQVKRYEKEDMIDDAWPMITVTYSSYDRIGLGKMNLYEAKKAISEAEEKLSANGIKGNFIRVRVTYTYQGNQREMTDTIILGEGRNNFIDYLSLSPSVITYMHRHVQIMETVERSRKEDAISPGTRAQELYEDMMLEWAEEQRRELNYNREPKVNKPPEWSSMVEQHKDWEMVR